MAFQVEEGLSPGHAYLKSFDALLRCPICFDFLNISMMTKCSHNFCSLCIRKHLSYKLQCPVCNAQVVEQDLTNNRLLDELITAFQATRQQFSNANLYSPPISPRTPASAIKCKTSKIGDQKRNSSVLTHFFQKKLKTSSAEETQGNGSVAQCVQRVSHTVTHNENDNDLNLKIVTIPKVENEEPLDFSVMSTQRLLSVKQEDAVFPSAGTGYETTDSLSPLKDVKPVAKVVCPVCSVSVSQHFINKHLDTCLTSVEKKDSLRSSFCKRRRPMSKLVYNILSVQELKRKLKECHLSTQGSRDQLIKRHKEFVLIYNAQSDALNPKSAQDIAKEVEANEKIRNQMQGKNKPAMVFSKNQSEEEINAMHSNYRKQHSSDFTRLIAQVRSRLESTSRVKQEVAEKEEHAKKTNPSDQGAAPTSWVIVKVEDGDAVEETSAQGISLSASPVYDSGSDVSISSSVSDIFGPEPSGSFEGAEWTSAPKRTSDSTDNNSAFIPGKRSRKK